LEGFECVGFWNLVATPFQSQDKKAKFKDISSL